MTAQSYRAGYRAKRHARVQPALLSNWHVLQGPNGELGEEVVQPGRFDDNQVSHNHLGVLAGRGRAAPCCCGQPNQSHAAAR